MTIYQAHTSLWSMIKHYVIYLLDINRLRKNLKLYFRERESTYGTISYAGHRPKEQMILHPFDEVEEDNFNQSRSSSPTDSILSDNSETSV